MISINLKFWLLQLSILSLTGAFASHAQVRDTVNVYPGNGIPSGLKISGLPESTSGKPGMAIVRNVTRPTMIVYKPAPGSANGTAMIVAPGGGFYYLAIDKDGNDITKWLLERGVTVFVLKYRLAETPPDDIAAQAFISKAFSEFPFRDANAVNPPVGRPAAEKARLLGEEDGRQAIRFVRNHLKEYGINSHRVGLIGFSAGGGVAINTALEHDSLSRPDVVAGIFAAWRSGVKVPNDAPPLFLAISDHDGIVGPVSSAILYASWHQAGKPAELHIFGSGEHGFGMHTGKSLADFWPDQFENWLKAQNMLPSLTK